MPSDERAKSDHALRQWLGSHGLEQYAESFQRNDVGLDVLNDLADADLEKLGVTLGDRKRLLKAISSAQSRNVAPAAQKNQASSTSEGEAERRQLTVLFCDLVGSTQLSQQVDPEDLRALMQTYQRTCAEIVARYDGHVAQYLGDGLMVYFGWPRAHEDDAERAVRSALELIFAVKRVAAPAPLQVRIGIATGPVVVGQTGGGDASVPKLAVGKTPNLAARLQSLSQPDQIIIAPSTHRLLGSAFEYQDMGEQVLKGIVEPVHAWRVVSQGRQEGRFEASREHAGLTRMVGRKDEASLLLRRWQQAKSGEGQVVLICGEPGIGKSRITQTLRRQIEQESHLQLHYQCSPYHVDSALYPIIAQFERAAGFERDDTGADKLDKMERWLAQTSADHAAATAPLMASLLALPGERYPALNLSPQKQKEKTLASLIDQLTGLSKKQPLLLVFEDAHWSDPTTQEWLDALIARIEQLAVLLVMTYRPEFTPQWVGQSQVTLLTLARLSRKEARALMQAVMENKSLHEEVVEEILAKTDCVPLFLEELTKAVLESSLHKATEHDQGLPRLAIPSTLQDSLMARLDKLATVKEIAQIGACIGRDFSYELLEAAADVSRDRLQSALADLIGAGLIFQHGVPPNCTYSFKHALVKDAAYSSLLRSRRELLHATIARTIEERFQDIVSSEPQVLAYHLSEAKLYKDAVDYWETAATMARKRYANVETVNHLKRALSDLQKLPVGPTRDAHELRLLVVLGNVQLEAEGYGTPEQRKTFDAMHALCERPGVIDESGEARRTLWWFELLGANYRRCREIIEQLESRVPEHQGRDCAFPVQISMSRLNTSYFTGDLRSARDQGQLLKDAFASIARPSYISEMDWIHFGCQGPDFLSWILLLLGYPDRAAREREHAVKLVREQGSPFSQVSVLTHSLCEHVWRWTPQRVQECATEALTLAEEHRLLFRKAEIEMVWGWAIAELGDTDRGLALLESGFRLANDIGFRIATSHWKMLFAYVYGRMGRVDDAYGAVDDALQFVYATEERFNEPELLRLQADLWLARYPEDQDKGEQLLLAAIESARQQSSRLFELRSSVELARMYKARELREEALELLQPIYAWFTEGYFTKDYIEATALMQELR